MDIFHVLDYICSMTDELKTENQRFRAVRQEQQMTQQAFAEILGIKGSTADIERGKTRIPGEVVARLLQLFNINPLWLYGESIHKYLQPSGGGILPKVVTLNSSDRENIALVGAKASAGYARNLQDPEWYDNLPAFDLPLPELRNATYRGFQVDGNSMYPLLHSGEWVIAQAVEHPDQLKDSQIYVVVLTDSVLVKKVFVSEKQVQLISINPDYPLIQTTLDDVREIWKVVFRLSSSMDVPEYTFDKLADAIKTGFDELKSRMDT